jgi:hypothetical protein
LRINRNKKECVDIIYPDNCSDASAQDLAYCEGFIARIFSTNNIRIKITINTTLKLVETNVPELKQYLDVVLKAKKPYNLYSQFNNLLFNKSTLKIHKQDKIYEINIQESGIYPDFTWIITKPS